MRSKVTVERGPSNRPGLEFLKGNNMKMGAKANFISCNADILAMHVCSNNC